MNKCYFLGLPIADYLVVVATGLVFIVCSVVEGVHSSLLGMLGVAGCGLGLLVEFVASLLLGIFKWRKSSRRWPVLPTICVAFLFTYPLSSRIGMRARIAFFEHRLTEYQRIVDGVKTGSIACSPDFSDIKPDKMPSGVLQISGMREPDGAILLMFLTGSGFPLYHEGYLYEDCKTNTNCAAAFQALQDKLNTEPIMTNWYHFSG